jgi:2-hydroxy-3-keto-5-methylthiopentenyl-1-phosphate phosphatase
MNYVSTQKYRKQIAALKEDETKVVEETVSMEGQMTMKERVSKLSIEEKEKLKQYIEAIKEIKKEMHELVNKEATVDEIGGNFSNGLIFTDK